MCQICEVDSSFYWTDTHGVGQCSTCGTPQVIYHYEDGKRVNKPPELAVNDEAIPLLKQYWKETHRTIPGGHSFPGGYEMASNEEQRLFAEWWDKHAPKETAAA